MYASTSTGQTRSAADAFLRSFQSSPSAFAVSCAFLAAGTRANAVVQKFAAQTISHLTLTPAEVSQLSSLFALHHHERDIVRLLGTALVRNMEAGQGLDWLIQGPWDADVRISLLTLAAVESVAYTEAQNVIVYLGSTGATSKDTLLCMAEWVKLLDRDARHPDLVIQNPLTTNAIHVLKRGLDDTSELFDAAVDLIVEVIRTYNSTLVDLPVIQWLIPQLMQLKPLLTSAVAQVAGPSKDPNAAKRPPLDETPLHTIFSFLPQFPAHPAIQYTSCLVISRYAEWLAGNGAAYLPALLRFVDATITTSTARRDYQDWQVPTAVAAALRGLCMDCWPHVGRDLMQYYGQLQASDTLHVDDQVILLEGICKGVSVGEPALVVPALETLVAPIVHRMNATLAAAQPSAAGILKDLLRLMCIFDHTTSTNHGTDHPLVALSGQLFPLFQQRMLRIPAMVVMVPSLAQLLVQCYSAAPQSSYLYCANQVVKHFGTSNSATDLRSIFDTLFTQLSQATFVVLNQSLVDHPDVVEEYFYMVERYVRSLPEITVPLLPSILQGSLLGLQLQHNDATKGVLSCLQLMFQQLTKHATDATAPTQAYTVRRSTEGHVDDRLAIAPEWMESALTTSTADLAMFGTLDATGRLPREDKAQFIQGLFSAPDESSFRRTVRHFSKLCRQRAVVV
ncbi:hypothetical protein DYB32_006598 [Aphanomyces invadans]|uniref:Exportin-1/Importin-beta-like domain-containing protein n=1 Tax=Aphanomyces invadans TaxID=157072 RepID=A0A418ARC5_9STRA|nr:hypothetical protein DYB32_006598 [Aphanomyces invadans]